MDQYIIIAVPPKKIVGEVEKYKKKYTKYAKYNIPPHITIYPPFFNLLPSEEVLVKTLGKALQSAKPTKVNFSNINFFEGRNNVVYFEPDEKYTKYFLDLILCVSGGLKNKVRNVFRNYNFAPDKFKPHMTIAERIPRNIFINIKKELQNVKVNLTFPVNSLYLYRLNSLARVWVKIFEIRLAK